MKLVRFGPEGLFAAAEEGEPYRVLYSDPFDTRPGGWEFGRELAPENLKLLAPIQPGKVLGIGRNYKEHVQELQNPMPSEPVLFLKAPSSVIGPNAPIVLPPESSRVEFEGEIAVVLRGRLRRATPQQARDAVLFLKAPSSVIGPNAPIVLPPESSRVEFEGEVAVVLRGRLTRATAQQARDAVLGVLAACDVTARDLQKKDPCFSRAKSFDSFCPLGPAVLIDPDLDDLEVATRINGVERQRGHVRDMSWGIVEQLVYASRMMTLEAGDVILTGTPSGVGPLAEGDRVEVEVSGVGVLGNPVEAFRRYDVVD